MFPEISSRPIGKCFSYEKEVIGVQGREKSRLFHKFVSGSGIVIK